MRKLRSNALWNTISPDRQKQIQHWLFDDNLSLDQTLHKIRSEFGIRCARSTIHGIYHYLCNLRSETLWLNAQDLAAEIAGTAATPQQLRDASKILLSARMVKIMSDPSRTDQLDQVCRLAIYTQNHDLHERRLSLMDRRLEFNRMKTLHNQRTKAEDGEIYENGKQLIVLGRVISIMLPHA